MEGVDVHRFSYFLPKSKQRLALGQGMRDNLRTSWMAKAQVPSFFAAQALATRRVIREQNIDVVNAHWLVPCGFTSAWACGGSEPIPLVLHVHAGDVYLLRRLSGGRHVARYAAARSQTILADGSHVRDTLDGLLGGPSHGALRPMGVDTEKFASPEEVPLDSDFPAGSLLFFGRLSEKKGAIYLIRAMPKVVERTPGLGLIVIGDGPERAAMEDEAERLGVSGSVRFLGRQPHRTIVQHLHACRAAVVPSIIDAYGETEGMPTVVLEAMAAGARVVGSAVDGIPDVLRHQENGWLCREKDPNDLAEKILDALNAPGASGVVRGAVATAAQHDGASVAGEYAKYLDEAVRRV
jgi:glycosyltransferase involved in cell wall biosynthesis